MDSTTYAIVGTLLLGLVGAAAFFLMQPAETKTRSAKGGLKPRGARWTRRRKIARTLHR